MSVVQQLPPEKTFLVGASVYESLAWLCKELDRMIVFDDFDIIVKYPGIDSKKDHPLSKLVVHNYWCSGKNKFGHSKFAVTKDRKYTKDPPKENLAFTVSLIPIESLNNITRRGVEPTIENYRSGVPLDIRAVSLDWNSLSVEGEGLGPIVRKIIYIKDTNEMTFAAKDIASLSKEEYIQRVLGGLPPGYKFVQ